MNKNIFLVAYICKCDLEKRKNPVNLSYFIIRKEPKNECQSHYSKELVYYCETCRLKICIDCYKEEHNNHEVNNNYLMSEKNEKNLIILIDKYKENLDKYDILKKIYDEYIKEKNTNNIEKINDNFNIINDNNFPNKINNDKLENGSINLKESHSNGKQIDISKNVFESGIQIENKFKQSVSNQNFNIKNSLLEEIIRKQNKNNNNNPSLYTSIKDNKNINNLNIDESQNNNDFRLFESRQINALNDSYEKPKNISLPPITEENNENKNITINEKINTINPKNEKLKYYYNCETLNRHVNRVISLIQLESGYLVSGSSDGEIIIWDIYKNKLITKFYEIAQVLCLLEFETNQLLVGTSENNIGLWDLNIFQENAVFNFLKHTLWVNCLVKIDNNTFASGSNDCKIYIWDYKKRIFLFELAKHEDCVITLIKLNDGRLCSGSADMTIKIWNLEKKECERELIDHKNWIKSIYQLQNGILLSSDDNNCLIIWKNFSLFKSINCSSQYRNFCQIDDNCLACASKDNAIDLFDLNNYQKYDTLTGHCSNVICIIKLKDNKLASCSLDKTIIIWEQKI
jgi:WD40 repeat protein